MANKYSLEKSLGPAPEKSSSPLMALPIIIPYPGVPGAPFFDGQNITNFLDRYSQLCSDYGLSESEKIHRLPWYCELLVGKYAKILISGAADWATVRSVLRKEYKDDDLDQLMNSREFLEAIKKKNLVPRTMISCTTANCLPQFLEA